jgi:hypothetical protein
MYMQVPSDCPTSSGGTRQRISCTSCSSTATYVAPYRGSFGLCDSCRSRAAGITTDTTHRTITFNQKIQFESCSGVMVPSSAPVVELLAKMLYDNPLPVQLEGHTATSPDIDRNVEMLTNKDGRVEKMDWYGLSMQRALHVCDRIIEVAHRLGNGYHDPEQLRTFLFPIGVAGSRPLPYGGDRMRVEVHFLDLS